MNESLTLVIDRRKLIANNIFFAGLILLVIGMPLSEFLMSVSQFVLIGSWIIAGNYRERAGKFFTDKVCLSLFAFYAIHVAGLLYTSDFNYAFRDLRIKLPLLILPFLIYTSTPLASKQFIIVLKFFVLSCLISTLISTAVWLGIYHKPVNDIREISVFISHIRLSLLICIAMFCCGYFIYNEDKNVFQKMMRAVLIIWFIIFLVILQSLTGLIIGSITLMVIIIQYLAGNKKYMVLAGLCILFFSAAFFIYQLTDKEFKRLRTEEFIDITNLPKVTSHGNAYTHETVAGDIENGHRIYLFICYPELEKEWNRRSEYPYDSLDDRKQLLMYTLIRYMTSKGLHKDADGVAQLSDDDIGNIEKGIGSINELNQPGFEGRIKTVIWELNNYLQGGDPSGHTLSMRFEFWKASISVIRKHLLIGVGTGDNQVELNDYYKTHATKLSPNYWLRSHNQFLAIGVSFGLSGLAVFIFSLFYPFSKLKMGKDFFYLTFFIIALLSFITEDTLETQPGATFFAFFNSFFLFGRGMKSTSDVGMQH